MRKFLLSAVVCVSAGCGMQPLPPGIPQAGPVTPITVEKTDKTYTDNAKAMQAVLRDRPVEVRRAIADVLPELANYIEQGHTPDAAHAFRLVTRAFADHPVISAQPMPEVAEVVNKALARWSKPAAMPTDWKTGMSTALQELADGAAAAVK